jgi:hypothetical protein
MSRKKNLKVLRASVGVTDELRAAVIDHMLQGNLPGDSQERIAESNAALEAWLKTVITAAKEEVLGPYRSKLSEMERLEKIAAAEEARRKREELDAIIEEGERAALAATDDELDAGDE